MKRRLFLAGVLAASLLRSAVAQVQPAVSPPIQPAPQVVAPKVTLTTSMGVIEITLDPVGAPKTSAHMLRLFRSTHYVGAAIYRIEPGFLIQLGDLDSMWKHRWPPLTPPDATVELETANNKHGRGTVSLARADAPNSGQSTFYFDVGDNSSLNATAGAPPNTTGYATFGRVTAGMDVIDAIAAVERAPTGGPFPGKAPKVPITILSVVTDPPPPALPRATSSAPKARAKGQRGRR